MVPIARVAGTAIRAGTAALASSETGLACKSLAARAISFGRKMFSSTAIVEGLAESRLAVAEAKTAVTREIAPGRVYAVSSEMGASSNPIWTATKERTYVQNAFDHWSRHGKEFPGIQNAKQNVEHAWKFRDRIDISTVTRGNGERLLYDVPTNTFGIFTRSGTPKTFFKPREKLEYFIRESNKIHGTQ